MKLWRVAELAEELRGDRVPERDKLGYLLATLVLQGIVGRSSLLTSFRSLTAVSAIVTILVVSAIGVVAAFRANGRGDGRHFLERYVCLSVPVGIRMYVLYMCIAVPVYLFTGLRAPTDGGRDWASWLVWIAMYYGTLIWFFAALHRYIAIASGARPAPPPR